MDNPDKIAKMAALREWARNSTGAKARKHVALDLDDCILDFTGGVRSSIATEFGVEVPPFTSWHIHEVLDPIIGYSWWAWMKSRDWIWKTFPAVEGAIGAIASLRKQGFYIEIVTSKPEWAEASVWQWLGRWRPAVHRVTIVGEKDEKVDATDAAVLVDDKPANCEAWAAKGRDAILFARPHNLSYKPRSKRIHLADGWNEVKALLEELYT